MSFFCARIKSDNRYLAFTNSFSAIICPVSSPGLWISSSNLTYTILSGKFLSLSGSRFVLTFELHDNSLKVSLTTPSSLVLFLVPCRHGPGYMSPARGPSVFPCPDCFFYLLIVSCTTVLILFTFHGVLVPFFWIPGLIFASLAFSLNNHSPDS